MFSKIGVLEFSTKGIFEHLFFIVMTDAITTLIASIDALHAKLDALVNPTQQDFLTRKQTAARLCMSLPTLNKHLRSGKIPFERIGRKILIPAQSIKNFS